MSKINLFLIAVLFLIFSGCAGSPKTVNNQSEAAGTAAYDALASMERAFLGEPLLEARPSDGSRQDTNTSGSSQSGRTSPAQTTDSRDKPVWVDMPDAVYSRQRYVSAVGFGSDRRQAEANALANLTGFFGQSVQAELKTVSTYSEAIMSGVIQVTENSSVHDAITTSIEMDTLMGAQIAEVWFDSINTWYAAAILEKDKSAVLYADLIRSNERIINDLTILPDTEKYSLGGYSRYLLAAAIADANRVYANVLTLVGNTTGINPGNMKKGDDFRIEASEISRNIPIAVNVEGDRAGRIRNALSRSVSSAGFRSGGNDSRYVLYGDITLTEASLPNQQNVFVRYIVDINLVDTADNSVLFPCSFNGREGHVTRPEAEERAFRAAENKITEEYGKLLRDYLSLLLPR